MSKITFEFNLPEDKSMVDLITHAEDMYFALDEICTSAGNELKHGDGTWTDHITKLLERIHDRASIVHEMEQ